MKKILIINIFLLIITSMSVMATDDYYFAVSEAFVNRYMKIVEKEFMTDSSLKDFKFEFTGSKRGTVKCSYSIVPVRIDFLFESSKVNQLDFYIENYKIFGFIPLSKKSLAKKISDAIKEAPALKDLITIAVYERGNNSAGSEIDRDLFSVGVRFQKSPIQLFPDLSITDADLQREKVSLSGNIILPGSNNLYDNVNTGSPSGSNIWFVNVNAANMRSGPGTDHSVMVTLMRDTRLQLLARMSNGWFKVKVVNTGAEGFIFADLLRQ